MENIIKNKIAGWLYRVGISANFVTWLGLFFAALSGLFIYRGDFIWAAAALLFSGLLDLLDGAIARASKEIGSFGGILDSTLDRYGDGFIFTGILCYCMLHQKYLYAVLAMSALLGSFLISYVRARAECVMEKCRVGFWERGDRIALLFAGLFFNNLPVALWVLGIATHGTALLRLIYANQYLQSEMSRDAGDGKLINRWLFRAGDRRSPLYLAKAGALFLAVLFLRLPF